MPKDLQQLKDEIRFRTDILDIIGQYTTLKRAGKNWKGLCPFHNDRNPSFNVLPEKQIYKCFSCGEGGDVFTFVQKKENLDFIEAMEFLARRAGIPFEWEQSNPEHKTERDEMLALNALAIAYYKEKLSISPEAKEYLAKRAILKSTQEQFEIGYAPPDWEGLTFYLQKHKADLSMAVKAGLIKPRQPAGQGYYDAFRHRLMFPIHDLNMRPIAFGGRAMGDDPAKYINSEQTPLFDKSRTLYGLCFARKHLSEKRNPVMVEGYIDVITAHQAGFPQCVATLGTSMTEEHGRLLARYSPRVLVCYDGDSAGIKATLRAAGVWEGLGIENAEVRIARLPADDDPDSVLKRGDTALFQKALDEAVSRIEFQIELALKDSNLETPEGKSDALKEVLPLIATVRSITERDRYIQRYAYLHPTYAYSLGRAVTQIGAEVERLSHTTRTTISPREQGYPLTEQINGAPMRQMPAPMQRRNGQNGKGDWKGKRNETKQILTDYSIPSATIPKRTRAQKAEEHLLRALFLNEWRTALLARLSPDDLVTENGRALLAEIARTPAEPSGDVDPLALLHRIERQEQGQPDEEDPYNEEIDQPYLPGNLPANTHSKKLSLYLQELLEESPNGIANDPITQASIEDCLTQIRRHRTDRELRDLLEQLNTQNLSDAERAQIQQKYHEKMCERRGTPTSETK